MYAKKCFPNLYAVLKNPPMKIKLNRPNIRRAIPRAIGFAFIKALLLYTDDSENIVIRSMTIAAIRAKLHNSIKHENRNLPFTTSFFAMGSKAEKTKIGRAHV